MSRRTRQFRDPTAVQAFPEELLASTNSVLQTVDEKAAELISLRFGFNSHPRTLAEIGHILGISRERARQIERTVVSQLRHPSRSAVLQGFLDGEQGRVPKHIRERLLGYAEDEQTRAFCDRHGWTLEEFRAQVCKHCPCFMPYLGPPVGRPLLYCSDACRQAAYRRRKSARRQTTVPSQP